MSLSDELANKIADSYTIEELEEACEQVLKQVMMHLSKMMKVRNIKIHGGVGSLVEECDKLWLAVCRKVEKKTGIDILKRDAFLSFLEKNYPELYKSYTTVKNIKEAGAVQVSLIRRFNGK